MVRVIWPVKTDYCQISRVNDDRLAANAIEAAEQTERLDIAEIRSFDALHDILAACEDDRLLIWCDEASAGHPALNITAALATAPPHDKAAILIGPEGGFDEVERSRLIDFPDALAVTLGPRLLRADTAAAAALSIWQAWVGDWDLTPS